ncbi:hypothetical protein [Helicobacter pylori]|uniref:hypothetical protein n=1 Tax=Helicobacter pylori TaxID=210 RepID=UPI001E4BA509|nr:hypothetical protein [Helicobacter pylori]
MCFNLTGGTKMMFLAGLKASEYFQAPYFYILKKKPNGYYFLKIQAVLSLLLFRLSPLRMWKLFSLCMSQIV